VERRPHSETYASPSALACPLATGRGEEREDEGMRASPGTGQRGGLRAARCNKNGARVAGRTRTTAPLLPSTIARSCTAHSLGEDGRHCVRCHGSASKVSSLSGHSPCFHLQSVDGVVSRIPPGQIKHCAGWLHSSHILRCHNSLKLWCCGACGLYSSEQIRGLASECTHRTNKSRLYYLNRIEERLWPKLLKLSEQRARGLIQP